VSTFLPGPAGQLESILWTPQDAAGAERAPLAAAVVCHPHPLGGGTMDNNVVFRVARALQAAGLAVLRFNFRGVGASAGEHDGHGAEEEDLRAALDFMQASFPGLALWAAGFSFGARTAAGLATRDERLERLLCVALPCKAFDCSMIRRVLPPTHVIQAGQDGFGNLADLVALAGPLPAHVDAEEIDGIDHFFTKRTPELEARVRTWAEASLASTR
jgi:alpha/beta superfamily hydrolase